MHIMKFPHLLLLLPVIQAAINPNGDIGDMVKVLDKPKSSPDESDSLPAVSKEETMYVRAMAKWASIASCDVRRLQTWTCCYCPDLASPTNVRFVGYYHDVITDAAAFVAQRQNNSTDAGKDDDIFVVFRASRGLMNWIYNLQFEQAAVPWPTIAEGATVHAGFWRSYASIREPILAQLRQMQGKVHLVGHSLGAAMATLCAMDLYSAKIVPDAANMELTTFGSPRVGNGVFASIFDSWFSSAGTFRPQHLRVVHQRDLVSHLPPRWLPLADYVHTAQEWWWKPANLPDPLRSAVKCDVRMGEDQRCSDQLDYLTVWDHFHFGDVLFGCALDPLHHKL